MPVKKLSGDIIFVDAHTRALAAFLQGLSEVQVSWEYEKLDWEAHKICVKWCKDKSIRKIADSKNRAVSKDDYEVLWLNRCTRVQAALKARRQTRCQTDGIPSCTKSHYSR